MSFHNPIDHDYPRGTLIHVHPMNTNDPQAPYGKEEEALANSIGVNERGPFIKPTGRAPMLSDEAIAVRLLYGPLVRDTSEAWTIGSRQVRDFYEAKITSGELMVVKKATWILIGHGYAYCSVCPYWYTMDMDGPPALHNFCPGCGAQIVKE